MDTETNVTAATAALKADLLSKDVPANILDRAREVAELHAINFMEPPDWVMILVGGNPEHLPAVVEMAVFDIQFEEGSDACE